MDSNGDTRARSAGSLHVVLVHPEIPWNAGNIGRTCLAAGAQLHLVRPLGFSLTDPEVPVSYTHLTLPTICSV